MDRKKLAEKVVINIVGMLQKGDLPPWRSPQFTGSIYPMNAVSKREYRGINIWLLAGQAMVCEYSDNRWMTFRQAKERGGHVRKGEKSTPVVFWKIMKYEDEHEDETKTVPLQRLYNVFNVQQTEGCDVDMAEDAKPVNHNPISSAERIFNNMPNRPAVEYTNTTPSYSFTSDKVSLPHQEFWQNLEEYYHVLFHELSHATAHKTRLDRVQDVLKLKSKKSKQYAQEELVAEMSAAILSANAGIRQSEIENSASYIDTWLDALKTNPDILVYAAQNAQKASDFILGNHIQP